MSRVASSLSLIAWCLLAVATVTSTSIAADEKPAAAEAPKAEQPAAHAADGHAPAAAGHDHGKDAAHAKDAAHGAVGDHAAGHGAGEHHAAGGHHEEHETGLPMNFKADLALWSLVTFLLFVFVLKQFAWGPLSAALDQREASIRKDIADAEANRLKAESLLKDYESKLAAAQEEVKAIIAEARRDAEHTKQDIMSTAQREAEATRQRAIGDIERARDAALGELFDFVSKNVLQATEQVLQRSLSGEDQERLVREALAQMDVRRN